MWRLVYFTIHLTPTIFTKYYKTSRLDLDLDTSTFNIRKNHLPVTFKDKKVLFSFEKISLYRHWTLLK